MPTCSIDMEDGSAHEFCTPTSLISYIAVSNVVIWDANIFWNAYSNARQLFSKLCWVRPKITSISVSCIILKIFISITRCKACNEQDPGANLSPEHHIDLSIALSTAAIYIPLAQREDVAVGLVEPLLDLDKLL
jgi:hypothetical protein